VTEPAVPRLAPVGLGAANLGNLYRAMSDDHADQVLQAAWDSGIRYFDTAPHYGLGLSEKRLGRFLATKPRGEFVVSTKVGRLLVPRPHATYELDDAHQFAVPAAFQRTWDFSEAGIRQSLSESLQRLGLDHVDVLLLHDPEEHDLAAALATGLPALARLKQEGAVGAVGVGSKSTAAHLEAVRSGAVDLLMVAGRLTLLEQPVMHQVVPECRDRGVRIIAAGVFNTGLLSRHTPDPKARYEYASVPPVVLQRAQRLQRVCEEYGVDLPTAALQYPLRLAEVASVVVGAASAHHVRDNMDRLGRAVPEALWQRLADEYLVVL